MGKRVGVEEKEVSVRRKKQKKKMVFDCFLSSLSLSISNSHQAFHDASAKIPAYTCDAEATSMNQ